MGSVAETAIPPQGHNEPTGQTQSKKLHGRAFYESIGSPKLILAPMVNQSEFAWRMLSRSFMPAEKSRDLLAYSPMFHAKHFAEMPKYRKGTFLPTRSDSRSTPEPDSTGDVKEEELYMDGNPKFDRPLFVQFCANSPDSFLAAAQHVQAYCDAVDLNLGCPQGIAKKGHYGAFLQEDWELINNLINKLHVGLDIPVTAKFRIQETKEKTLEYAKMILKAGASIITVHGRQREQKGHNTGLADWSVIRYLREHLPSETVIFANGNILQHEDIEECLKATGADGVMSAEGNLFDPTIFAEPPPTGEEGREYWRGKDGNGGYRMDAVLRRYMDILYKHVLEVEPPNRKPLFILEDLEMEGGADVVSETVAEVDDEADQPPRKKVKVSEPVSKSKPKGRHQDPNMGAVQPHLFSLLRSLVSVHHNVRDTLARYKGGDMETLEEVLRLVEEVTRQGIIDEDRKEPESKPETEPESHTNGDPSSCSADVIAKCRRPFFICQPYIRPLPAEAYEKGSMQLSKKEKKKRNKEQQSRENLENKPDPEKPEPIRNSVGTVQPDAIYG